MRIWGNHKEGLRLLQENRGDGACLIRKTFQLAVSILGLVLLSYGPERAAEQGSPIAVVRGAVDQVMKILADQDWKRPERARERHEWVARIIDRIVDYDEMAMRTMGQEWNGLSDTDRKEFVEAFKLFMEASYEGRLKDYSGEEVRYLGEQVAGDFAEVRTRLVSSKVELPLNCRLLKKADAWRIYDLVVDGVSLVGNYRAQFANIIRTSSYQALLGKLTSKTGDIVGPF